MKETQRKRMASLTGAESEDASNKCVGVKVTPPLRKRVKFGQPEPKPNEPRNLEEEVWKAAFPLGTNWHKLSSFSWDFSNLEHAFEEGGKLHHETIGNDNKVYLFGIIEGHTQRTCKVIVPVVVAVVSPSLPSYELSIKSVDSQEGGREIIAPMKQVKMDWIPVTKSPQVFVVGRTESWVELMKHSKEEERLRKFKYGVPCLHRKEEYHGCLVEREMDEHPKFIIYEVIEAAEELFPALKPSLKEFVLDTVHEAKRSHGKTKTRDCSSEKSGTTNVQEEASEAEASGFENMMRVYKLYPAQTPEIPDISKAKYSFVNRYYGKAHEVL